PLPAEEQDRGLALLLRLLLGRGADEADGTGDPLQVRAPAVDVTHPGDSARNPAGALADDHLAAAGERAEPRGDVERRAAERAGVQKGGLAGVDSDLDSVSQWGIRLGVLGEPALEVHPGPDCLAGRVEDGQRLVAPDLDQLPA